MSTPIIGSNIICVVNQAGQPVRVIGVEGGEVIANQTIRLLIELPSSALRDLGIVTVDGTVDITALPAGTNLIGNVKISDGTDTATVRPLGAAGAVDVAILDGAGAQITSFGGGTQYAEDTPHVTGDQLTLAGVVQQAADAALAGDLDRAVLQVDANGFLKVNVKTIASVVLAAGTANIGDVDVLSMPTGASAAQVQGTAADGAAVVGNPVRIGYKDAAGNTQDWTGNTSGVPAMVQSFTGADALVNTDLGIDVNQLGSPAVKIQAGYLFNGTTWDRVRGNTSGAFAQGDVAHDVGNAGNPVQMGGHAVAGGATPTPVAAADRVRWIFNQHGIPWVMGGHPNLITREFDFGAVAQTDLNLAAAVVAGDERIYVTRFEALCDNANTVAVAVRAGFGTANVPTASATGVSGMIASHPGIAAGSGIICGAGAGIIAVGGLGEEPRLTSGAATSGNLHVVISYYLVDETP